MRPQLLAYNIQPFPSPNPRSKAQKQDISPARPHSQTSIIEESYAPPTHAAGIQDLRTRVLKSRDLIILSSSIGDLLGCNMLPQGVTGRHRPPDLLPQKPTQISLNLNRRSRLHRNAKQHIWAHWLFQWSPNGTRASQQAPKMVKGFQNVTHIVAKSVTTQT